VPTFGLLREAGFWLPFPEDESALAPILLYCWAICTGKPIAALIAEASNRGWVKPPTVKSAAKKKGGRPPGPHKRSKKYLNEAQRLLKEIPTVSKEALITEVALRTFAGRVVHTDSPAFKKHRDKVKRRLKYHRILEN
jgi:hypothetical protein